MDAIDQADAVRESHNTQALKIHIIQTINGKHPFHTDYCADCGELIPSKRKLAYPEAVRCIDCQSKFEKRNNRA